MITDDRVLNVLEQAIDWMEDPDNEGGVERGWSCIYSSTWIIRFILVVCYSKSPISKLILFAIITLSIYYWRMNIIVSNWSLSWQPHVSKK